MPPYVVALAHFTRASISAAYTETLTMHASACSLYLQELQDS